MPSNADLSAAWFRELEVAGSYGSAESEPAAGGRAAFEIATELVAGEAVGEAARLVVTYPLHRWREALDHAHSAGRLGAVKVAFDPAAARQDPASASDEPGSTSNPPSPTTSGRLELRDATTGVPKPSASSAGKPKPS